jgi:predicted nucleotidyltransferase
MNSLINKFPIPNLDVVKIYLFGSYINGNGNDVDLLIISNDFEGVSRAKRQEKVMLNFLDTNVDPVCVTTNEFDRLLKQKSIFLTKILKTALLIYERKGN